MVIGGVVKDIKLHFLGDTSTGVAYGFRGHSVRRLVAIFKDITIYATCIVKKKLKSTSIQRKDAEAADNITGPVRYQRWV